MKELQTSLMKPLGNDRWRDEFSVEMLRRYQYTVEGRIVFALALAVGLGSKKFVTKSLERDTKKVSSDTVEDPPASFIGHESKLNKRRELRLLALCDTVRSRCSTLRPLPVKPSKNVTLALPVEPFDM